MNKVQRAIIIAAGIGKRMQPVTLDTPKPLIRVNGMRMIDTIIQGLQNNRIMEIYLVVGYLNEQFQVLQKEYKGVHIIENPFYDTCNNISSLYMARDYIENAIILDGDQMIYNNDVLSPEFKKSEYNAIWTEKETKEWLMQVKNGKVIACSKTGGKAGWQLFSISRWTAEDGRNRQLYWDDVVMFCHLKEYDLGIRPMKREDVIEIDNLKELVALDSNYKKYLEVL